MYESSTNMTEDPLFLYSTDLQRLHFGYHGVLLHLYKCIMLWQLHQSLGKCIIIVHECQSIVAILQIHNVYRYIWCTTEMCLWLAIKHPIYIILLIQLLNHKFLRYKCHTKLLHTVLGIIIHHLIIIDTLRFQSSYRITTNRKWLISFTTPAR
jgi:hypothetical protein